LGANNPPTTGVFIMNSVTAMSLGMMMNPLGQPEFSGIGISGGSLNGIPVIVSDYVPVGTVILTNATDIYLGDDGGISVDMSREASLEMSDAPAGDAGAGTGAAAMVSLWQTNSVGFLAERTINWKVRRAGAVQLLSGVDWGGGTP
jgi:hypothetical protein